MTTHGAATGSAAEFFDELRPRFVSLELTNFLSYKDATLHFGDFVALIGPNASGKSNAVAAIKLLHEIALLGLPTAIARRGGFDQLRHRSAGRPYDPEIKLTFNYQGARRGPVESHYELRLGAVKGQRYKVKRESAAVSLPEGDYWFESDGKRVNWGVLQDPDSGGEFVVAPGQSALSVGGYAGFVVFDVLKSLQTVEVNPAKVSDLQEPSSTTEFEPDGSNVASVFEMFTPAQRQELVDELAAIVPGIVGIETARLADRQTLRFRQQTESGVREFYAKQMSDGTLRALAILMAALMPRQRGLLVIEEPEIAIHLGALQTLVELLQHQTAHSQILITTHSADIVDALPVEALRVVWSQGDASHVANVAEHTRATIRDGLITPGELLRADSLDPGVA